MEPADSKRAAGSPASHFEFMLDYLRPYQKPENEFLVGIEAEFVGVDASSGSAIPYEGSGGVESVLIGLSRNFGWEILREQDRVTGLRKGTAEVHLEPGGQIELSGTPSRNIRGNMQELSEFCAELREISRPERVAWLELGTQPFSRLEEIPWVPKERYRILRRYLAGRGVSSHRMMKQTATLQANLDFSDTQDAMLMMRTAMGIAPIMAGVFANSPLLDGKSSGYASTRSHIWMHTDPVRCGLIEVLLVDRPSLEDYVRFLLEMPVIFVQRGPDWLDAGGVVLGDYLRGGISGIVPQPEDWDLFLSTVFTDARLNPFVELRTCDRNSMDLSGAMLALWKGLLFDPDARDRAWALVRDWTYRERRAYYDIAARDGFKAVLGASTVRELGLELVALAQGGLQRRHREGCADQDESVHLETLTALLTENRRSPGEELLELWEGPWHENPLRLIEHTRI